jgi:hypothetical protein
MRGWTDITTPSHRIFIPAPSVSFGISSASMRAYPTGTGIPDFQTFVFPPEDDRCGNVHVLPAKSSRFRRAMRQPSGSF